CLRDLKDVRHRARFELEHAAAQRGDVVVAAARVVRFTFRRLVRLVDEPKLEQPLHRAVKRSRPEHHLAAGRLLDLVGNAEAVTVFVGERQQDLRRHCRQRHHCARAFIEGSLRGHKYRPAILSSDDTFGSNVPAVHRAKTSVCGGAGRAKITASPAEAGMPRSVIVALILAALSPAAAISTQVQSPIAEALRRPPAAAVRPGLEDALPAVTRFYEKRGYQA